MNKNTTPDPNQHDHRVVREASPRYPNSASSRVMPTDFMCDTDLETQRKYYALLKAMPQEKRIAQALKWSKFVRAASIEAITKQHPEYTRDDVRREYLRRILPPKQFHVFYPEPT